MFLDAVHKNWIKNSVTLLEIVSYSREDKYLVNRWLQNVDRKTFSISRILQIHSKADENPSRLS